MAVALRDSRYRIREIVHRDNAQSRRRAAWLARRVDARVESVSRSEFNTEVTWICVPDDAILDVADELSSREDWRGKIVLHSSGALPSTVLSALKKRGAAVASLHPLMTFVSAFEAGLHGVPFALEGDAKAISRISAVIRKLGGTPFRISAKSKPAYHAFGFFSSPALVVLIAAAQEAGKLAGFNERQARALMQPIVRQTIDNCFGAGPRAAFSGPLRRGDVVTIRKHLDVLRQSPELLELYKAIAKLALKKLPVGNAAEIRQLISNQ